MQRFNFFLKTFTIFGATTGNIRGSIRTSKIDQKVFHILLYITKCINKNVTESKQGSTGGLKRRQQLRHWNRRVALVEGFKADK